jgi:hypothetical protein
MIVDNSAPHTLSRTRAARKMPTPCARLRQLRSVRPHHSFACHRASSYSCSDQILTSKMRCEQGLKQTLTGLRDIVISLMSGLLNLNDLRKSWVLTHICAVLTEAEQQPNNLPRDFLHELQKLCLASVPGMSIWAVLILAVATGTYGTLSCPLQY